jgi:hypothetical protein
MKTISDNDIEFLMEWSCPYVKCGALNTEYGDCGEGEILECRTCKREVRVREPD